ncbi:MAG: hypothetical protein ACK5ME_09355, partial [Parahaliea sp.]
VSVPLHRQAEGLQGRIRGGLGQPVEAVVAVICLAQFAAELRDVAGTAVLVLPLAQALAAAVAVADADIDGQGALPAIVGECSGDSEGAYHAGTQPQVLAITEPALVRQGDLAQQAVAIVVGLLAAIGTGVAV